MAPSLAEAVGRLCDSRLLDRLVRGRFWIGFVAFALIGIVAMQLALLKLNTGIGRDIERESLLQRQNADLEAEVSGMAAVDGVQSQAAALGMVAAAPGSARFLTAGGAASARAAAALDAALSSASTLASPPNAISPGPGAGAGAPAATGAAPAGASTPSSSTAVPSSSVSASSTAATAATPPSGAASATVTGSPQTNSGSSPGVSSPPAPGAAGGGASAPVGG